MVHALGEVSKKEFSEKLNLGPLPRGGNSYTLDQLDQITDKVVVEVFE